MNLGDEAWFVQVIRRVSGGETLYEDVALHVTPLAVYVLLAPAKLFGVDIGWSKLVVIGAFVATLSLSLRIVRIVAPGSNLLVLPVAILALAPPMPGAAYQPLAVALALGSFLATLKWVRGAIAARRDSGPYLLVLASALAALAFATKQSVGLYAFVAVVGASLLGPSQLSLHRRLISAAWAAATFVATAALVLSPIVLQRTTSAFIDEAFASILSYADYATVSYLHHLTALRVITPQIDSRGDLLTAYELALFVLPLAVFACVAARVATQTGLARRTGIVVALFTLSGFLGVFPRADDEHLMLVMPYVLIAAWYAFGGLATSHRRRQLVAIGVVIALLPALFWRVGRPATYLATGELVPGALPQLRGTLISRAEQTTLARNSAAIAASTNGEPTFLLTVEAGLYYLLTGIENPTPFDYPDAFNLGPEAQRAVVGQLQNGSIARVCAGMTLDDPLAPRYLVAYVRSRMRPIRDAYACTLYVH